MNAQKSSLYLDYAATTPLAPEVFEAMTPILRDGFGNASSIHRHGREARAAMDDSRESLAQLLHADFSEVYFTGSGTESDNLALIGTMLAAAKGKNHLVTTEIEHHAVLHAAHWLQERDFEVTLVSPDRYGNISPENIAEAMTEKTALVSVMHANNEIGTIQDIKSIAKIAHENGAKFHTDAVQSAPYLSLNVDDLNCDLLSFCAHKMYGPKGAGALYIRQGTKLNPVQVGGAQEREKRAGTENVAAIVGFGRAAELVMKRRETDNLRLTALRDRFIWLLETRLTGVTLNGDRLNRLPNNVNVSLEGVEGSTLLMRLDRAGISASSGSACSSGSIEPSHVLKAIGLSDSLASSGVRFSLGRETTEEDLETAVEALISSVNAMRR
ncbi:MAG: cysteine desulfurase [Chthonomonadaceae bacterium]|nr:cysteine desulfurase [Chthonomonadaceae bacterium]